MDHEEEYSNGTIGAKFCALSLVALLSSGLYAGFFAGSVYQRGNDVGATKQRAIEHNCGEYDAKTGAFKWVSVETADSALASQEELRMGAADQNSAEVRAKAGEGPKVIGRIATSRKLPPPPISHRGKL